MNIEKTPHICWADLGKVYQAIEEAGAITRIELAQKTQLSSSAISFAIQDLLRARLIMQQFSSHIDRRGRKIASLSLSPFYWQLLYAELTENFFSLCLTQLDGEVIYQDCYTFTLINEQELTLFLTRCVTEFLSNVSSSILAFAMTIDGLQDQQGNLVKLGKHSFSSNLNLSQFFEAYFSCIWIEERGKRWAQLEMQSFGEVKQKSTLFVWLGEEDIELWYLEPVKKALFPIQAEELWIPPFHPWQSKINPSLPNIVGYQLRYQSTVQALMQYFDLAYPDQQNLSKQDKLSVLYHNIRQGKESAVQILEIFAKSLSMGLNSLINIFNAELIILETGLLDIAELVLPELEKQINLWSKLSEKNRKYCSVRGSQEHYSGIKLAQKSVKQAIYSGKLFENIGKNKKILNF